MVEWAWVAVAWTFTPFSALLLAYALNAWQVAHRNRADPARTLVARTNVAYEALTLLFFFIAAVMGALAVSSAGSRPDFPSRSALQLGLLTMQLIVAAKSLVRFWTWRRLISDV